MAFIRFVYFLFYRYYTGGGTRRIPYLSTLCALTLLTLIHIFQVLIIFNGVENVIPGKSSDGKLLKFLKMTLFILPIIGLFSLLVKERELKSMTVPAHKIKRGYILLVFYIILSFGILIFLIVLKRKLS